MNYNRWAMAVVLLTSVLTGSVQAQQWNPSPSWKDSYAVGGRCYCDSNFDHGLSDKSADTPLGRRAVQQICADISDALGSGSTSGRIYYNDIQCGNGPANDAADERGCPGRIDIGPSGCNQIGPKWDLAAVYGTKSDSTPPKPSPAPSLTTTGGPSCSATADGLGEAKIAFASSCPGLARIDCDPTSDGRWQCSSEDIASAAPTPSSPKPAPAPAPAPAPEPTPVESVAGDSCSATAAGLGAARDAFAVRCAGFARVDCDPVGGDRWQCSSDRLGGSAPGSVPLARAPTPATLETSPDSVPDDGNGNGVPDVFEADASSDDGDGDFVSDAFDVNYAGGEDRNANGIADRFESALTDGDDADGNGLLDRYEPRPVGRSATNLVPLPAPRRTPLLVVDYESGTLDSGIDGLGPSKAPAADAFRLNSSTPRSGSFAVAHTVKLADDYRSNGAWRSESDTVSLLDTRYDEGDEVRYMFSTYLAPPWPADPGNLEIIFQWKRFSSRPDMFVAIVGDEVVFRALHGDQAVRRQVISDYRVGKWIDFRFDISWSAGSGGSVDMAFKYADESDYRRVGTYRGANMLASGPIDSTYLKWGNYKPLFKSSVNPELPRTILHDDIRVIPLD